MSLATRCSACGTVFRVVQDQLKVSQGWVRCGHCQAVFNGQAALFELAPPPPGQAVAPAVRRPPVPTPPAPQAAAAAAEPTRPGGARSQADFAEPPATAMAPTPPTAPLPGKPTPAVPPPEPSRAQTLPSARPPSPPAPPISPAPPPEGRTGATRAGIGDGLPGTALAMTPRWAVPSASGLPPAWARPPAANEASTPAAAPLVAAPIAPTDAPAPTLLATSPAAQAAPDIAEPHHRPEPSPPTPAGAAHAAAEFEFEPTQAIAPDDWFDGAPAAATVAAPTPAAAAPPPSLWEAARPLAAVRIAGAPATITQTDLTLDPPSPQPLAPPLRSEPPLEPVHQPEFVRRADRAALWRRPAVRGLLALACLLLSAMLVAQMAWRWRDAWAARFPVLRPVLSAAAEGLGQRLHSPRALERIVLDASDLGRTHTPGVLRLVADLRNTASHAVRAPALDVSFSDAEGVLLVRRVFLPTELGLVSEELAAESGWAVDARVQVGKLRVAGYKIDVFYP